MTEELVWSSDSELEDTVPEPAPTPEPIKEEVIQTKPKKPRSEAQIAAFAKAREKRMANIKAKKDTKTPTLELKTLVWGTVVVS